MTVWPHIYCPIYHERSKHKRSLRQPTPEVAFQVKIWRRRCAATLWAEYDTMGRPHGHPPKLSKRDPDTGFTCA